MTHDANGGTSTIVPPVRNGRARRPGAALAALGALLAVVALGARAPRAAQFSSRVSLVEVYATVTDERGAFVPDLRAADFVVEEEGVPQSVTAFAAGDVALSVALGIDRSFSMPAQDVKAASASARRFVDGLGPRDRVMVVAIGSGTEVLSPLSSPRADARAALARIERWGTTPLHDAVVAAIDAVEPAEGRRALILLSDGVDRYSAAGPADVVAYAREHDVLIYPVSIGRARPSVWAEVAAVSGGRSFFARGAADLDRALAAIADDLRHQYLLGYVPRAGVPPGWRTIRVRVNRPRAVVRAREGYRAPGP